MVRGRLERESSREHQRARNVLDLSADRPTDRAGAVRSRIRPVFLPVGRPLLAIRCIPSTAFRVARDFFRPDKSSAMPAKVLEQPGKKAAPRGIGSTDERRRNPRPALPMITSPGWHEVGVDPDRRSHDGVARLGFIRPPRMRSHATSIRIAKALSTFLSTRRKQGNIGRS